MGSLSELFLMELLKACLRSPAIMKIVDQYMEFNYLPSNSYKMIWKTMRSHYRNNGGRIPTVGLIYESNKYDQEALDLLEKIKDTERPNDDDLVKQFEIFVKQSKFVELHTVLSDLWGEGKKEEAFDKLQKDSETIARFSMKGEYYEPIFGGYKARVAKRKIKRDSGKHENEFIPTLIDAIDAHIIGVKKKQTFLLLAQSGYGKSTFLRWLAVAAARMGFKVLFISAEDSKEEVEMDMDATWMNAEASVLNNDIPEELMHKYGIAASNVLQNGGEIFVRCYERHGEANIAAVYGAVDEVSDIDNRDVDYVILDFLEKFDPMSTHEKGNEMDRRMKVAEDMKILATDKNVALATATQGSTVDKALLDDPSFVMTRHNISRVKALVESFSYFFTLNMTRDERVKGICRLYADKFRRYASEITFMIAQSLNRGQAYDPIKTRNLSTEAQRVPKSEQKPKRRRKNESDE